MTITFDRKLSKQTELDLFSNLSKRKELINKAIEEIFKDPTKLDQVRYSLIAHAAKRTRLSLSTLDAALESKLKREFRKKGTVFKIKGSRNLEAVSTLKRKLQDDESEQVAKKPREDDPKKRKREEPTTTDEPTPTEELTPTEEPAPTEEPTIDEEPTPTEEETPIDITKLPEETLDEYVEINTDKNTTIPAGAQPYTDAKDEEPQKLGDQKVSQIETKTGKTLDQMFVDADYDNGGHDITIMDNGGELVRRELFNQEMDLEQPTTEEIQEPLDTEAPVTEEETTPDVEMKEEEEQNVEAKEEEPVPEKPDVVMKDTPQLKRELKQREKTANIRERIFSKIAKQEAEFKQAMAGTFMAIRDTGEGLLLNLKKSKALERELKKEVTQQIGRAHV